MKKALAIQRNKLASSYGGAGSFIDTIDNLSYQIESFDQWPIYDSIERRPQNFRHLLHKEDRLISRLRSIGFNRVEELFLTDDFDGEDIKEYYIIPVQARRMVSASYFPRWFFCPKCKRFHSIDKWREIGQSVDYHWGEKDPKCGYCLNMRGVRSSGPKLQQVRFVLASMETGEIIDLPWDKIYSKKGRSDNNIPGVWDFRNIIDSKNVSFHVTKGSSDLNSIYVRSENGIVVTMTEIVNRYFIMKSPDGKDIVYRPVVKNANNVYFPYIIQSVYIPKHDVTQADVDSIRGFVQNDIDDCTIIKKLGRLKISVKEIRAIIDNDFVVPTLTYSSDLLFRLDEFNNITDESNYENGIYTDDTGERLESVIYQPTENIPFVRKIYLLRKMNVTGVQVGYSRIDKISPNDISNWKGRSENPKYWLNLSINKIDKNVDVAIHPTCSSKISDIKKMPAVSSMGEGFMVVLDLESIQNPRHKEIFLHTFSHLIMKSLEFQCGYPVASMNERLYVLPHEATGEVEDKYGFMIYSANGEAGSYGGISSLFDSHLIEKILVQSLESADDCPNDPICESEGGSCFACVQIPETACERFNSMLSRNIAKQYRIVETDSDSNPPTTEERADQSFISEIESLMNE